MFLVVDPTSNVLISKENKEELRFLPCRRSNLNVLNKENKVIGPLCDHRPKTVALFDVKRAFRRITLDFCHLPSSFASQMSDQKASKSQLKRKEILFTPKAGLKTVLMAKWVQAQVEPESAKECLRV